jgi:hypothetical protein
VVLHSDDVDGIDLWYDLGALRTLIANAFFMPSHLLSQPDAPRAEVAEALADGST